MNAWLVVWLALLALAPIFYGFLLWYDERRDGSGYEALGLMLLFAGTLLISMIGAIGTVGWLIVWAFG